MQLHRESTNRLSARAAGGGGASAVSYCVWRDGGGGDLWVAVGQGLSFCFRDGELNE